MAREKIDADIFKMDATGPTKDRWGQFDEVALANTQRDCHHCHAVEMEGFDQCGLNCFFFGKKQPKCSKKHPTLSPAKEHFLFECFLFQ
jgi:hypothetical protein